MAAYHADDIRNLKKMIGFIEDHTVSIEEEKLKKELARVNGMLNNEKFMSKAPQAKIEEEKAKLEKYQQMMAQVQERLTGLKK